MAFSISRSEHFPLVRLTMRVSFRVLLHYAWWEWFEWGIHLYERVSLLKARRRFKQLIMLSWFQGWGAFAPSSDIENEATPCIELTKKKTSPIESVRERSRNKMRWFIIFILITAIACFSQSLSGLPKGGRKIYRRKENSPSHGKDEDEMRT